MFPSFTLRLVAFINGSGGTFLIFKSFITAIGAVKGSCFKTENYESVLKFIIAHKSSVSKTQHGIKRVENTPLLAVSTVDYPAIYTIVAKAVCTENVKAKHNAQTLTRHDTKMFTSSRHFVLRSCD